VGSFPCHFLLSTTSVWCAPYQCRDEQAVQGAMAAHLAALEAIADAQGPLQEWQPQPAQQWAVHLAWLATRLEPDMWPPRLSVMLVEAGSFLVQVSGPQMSRRVGSSIGGAGLGAAHAFCAVLQPARIECCPSLDFLTRCHDACTKVRCHGACTLAPPCLPPVRPGRRAWRQQWMATIQRRRPALSWWLV